MSELSELDTGFDDMVEQQLGPMMPQQQIQPQNVGTQGVPGQPVRNNHGNYVEFYMHPVQNQARSAEEGRPIFDEIPYIMIMTPGDKSSIVRRPVRTGQHPRCDNNMFPIEYQAFTTNQKAPVQGTPIEQWPMINSAQVKELEYLGIRSVENLANMNDGLVSQYMGMADLKMKARAWLERAREEAPYAAMQAELEDRDARIASQAQAIEAQNDIIQKLEARLGQLENAAPTGGQTEE